MQNDTQHVEGAVRALAQLRDEHERKATPAQRFIAGITKRAASPGFIMTLTAILIFLDRRERSTFDTRKKASR
jgi:hypothetical protein